MSSFTVRFAAEVAFLAFLALAVGLAELATAWIIAVMTVGWVLVLAIEWLAWRSETILDDGPPPTEGDEPGPDESTSWDLEEILAPVPEDEK